MNQKIIAFLVLAIICFINAAETLTNVNITDSIRLRRMTGGKLAKPGHHPYQVAIYSGMKQFVCAGVIIKPTWVLTAAHCNDDEKVGELVIVAGTNLASKGGIVSSVRKIVNHGSYNKTGHYENDIALLKTVLNFGKYFRSDVYKIRPIKISEKPPHNYIHGTLVGWGQQRPGGFSVEELEYSNLEIFSGLKCRRLFVTVPDSTFCAGNFYLGAHACKGDSGGPLINRYGKLMGIVSLGPLCGTAFVDKYTNVYLFRNWIEENSQD